MRVLVLNSGSSSIKYKLFNMAKERVLAEGHIADIGGEGLDASGRRRALDHDEGLELVFAAITADPGFESNHVDAIGHRVVHGGSAFTEPAIVDDAVCAAIEAYASLAPLHNPANLKGIKAAQRLQSGVPQVAVFDTAFHQTIPPVASTYPLPQALAGRHSIRRFGFHGTSCAWALSAVAAHLGCQPGSLNVIIAHLGAGASVTAIHAGRSVDTSMGLSPLEGVMMQTRAGDLDPAILLLLLRSGMSIDEVDGLLNHNAGVKGVAGDADMLAVEKRAEAGDRDAILAREIYVHRARKYIGAYAGLAWPLDALIFTGGVGENDAWVRLEICRGLPQLGLVVDEGRNAGRSDAPVRCIGSAGGGTEIIVVRADEELQIARETAAAVGSGRGL